MKTEKYIYKFYSEKLKHDHHLKVLCRRKNNIKMDLKGTGFEDVDWTRLAQDRDQRQALMNRVMNLRVLHKRYMI
jgi:phage terminase Nu1 subunit (DNA packaging protein)